MPLIKFEAKSCDTFVVLPPCTALNCVVFGKNSDRPKGEVQEVVYNPSIDHEPSSKLQCTYIMIDQVENTHAVILSKPAWMWGAEMGANEHGVCIGNEAVHTKLMSENDLEEKLLGMDLVRLGLERSSSAREAVDVLTTLLESYGQGGPCSDSMPSLTYHNSFLIADRKEAWVLETAGRHWAAEHITDGTRNISNCLSIGKKIDLMSKHLKNFAQSNGFWDPANGEFDFALAYGSETIENGVSRFTNGQALLNKLSSEGKFDTLSMFDVLRDCDSGICRSQDHAFPTTGSQVSVLSPPGSTRTSCHWFTGTPDPKHSVFKPFVFCTTNRISRHIISPTFGDEDPVKVKPRFQKTVDRSHLLYRKHHNAYSLLTGGSERGNEINNTLRQLEKQCVIDMETFVENFTPDKDKEIEDLFKDLVESEIKFYQ